MFEPVLQALVDFDRSIVIDSRWRPGDHDPVFLIEYEPEISRSDYAEELEGIMLEIWQRYNNGPPPPTLRNSPRRRRLFSISSYLADGCYNVGVSVDDRNYWTRDSNFLHLPENYLDLAVSAIARHPFWDDPAVGRGVRISLKPER